jgi:hypothetical protein
MNCLFSSAESDKGLFLKADFEDINLQSHPLVPELVTQAERSLFRLMPHCFLDWYLIRPSYAF